MKKLNNIQRFLQLNVITAIALMAILLASSCNKDFPNTLKTEYPNDTLEAKGDQRKVLYLILDGVRGQAIDTLKPSTITLLARNSIYTYDGLVDANSNPITDGSAWANMLTGVNSDKHQVTTNDFAGNNLTAYPTIFTRLKSLNPNERTVSIAATEAFNNNLATDATVKQTLASDEEVKTAVINELKNNDAKLVVAQFHNAEVVGNAGSFRATNADYAQAIRTLDTYVANIMDELKARKNYKNENWLVVIASNKGGNIGQNNSAAGAFGDDNRNSFVILHNPKFFRQSFAKPAIDALPYMGFAPRFSSSTSKQALALLSSNTNIGNFDGSGEYTLMFKIRYNNATGVSWPHFFGKRNLGSGFSESNSPGWSFLFAGDEYQFDWSNSSRPNIGVIRDGLWHTLGFSIRNQNGQRIINEFTDGVNKFNKPVPSAANNNGPLRIGADMSDKATDFLFKDLVILNVGLSDVDMAQTMRKEMSNTSPYYNKLIGWWPMNETSGSILQDMSGKGNNFTLNDNVNFAAFEDKSPNISPNASPATFRAVVNNADIPVQIYQWMGISSISSWSLDGRAWKIIYSSTRN